jgi:acetamidase/formamidase
MAKIHHLSHEQGVHWFVLRDIQAPITVDPDDTVVFQTLDSGWGAIERSENFSEPKEFSPRDVSCDVGHALTGPVEIRDALPGYGFGDSPRTDTPGELELVSWGRTTCTT